MILYSRALRCSLRWLLWPRLSCIDCDSKPAAGVESAFEVQTIFREPLMKAGSRRWCSLFALTFFTLTMLGLALSSGSPMELPRDPDSSNCNSFGSTYYLSIWEPETRTPFISQFTLLPLYDAKCVSCVGMDEDSPTRDTWVMLA